MRGKKAQKSRSTATLKEYFSQTSIAIRVEKLKNYLKYCLEKSGSFVDMPYYECFAFMNFSDNVKQLPCEQIFTIKSFGEEKK